MLNVLVTALDLNSRFMKWIRVPANATRCRVMVTFHGQAAGSKTFAC
jgi:hypothetical protein